MLQDPGVRVSVRYIEDGCFAASIQADMDVMSDPEGLNQRLNSLVFDLIGQGLLADPSTFLEPLVFDHQGAVLFRLGSAAAVLGLSVAMAGNPPAAYPRIAGWLLDQYLGRYPSSRIS